MKTAMRVRWGTWHEDDDCEDVMEAITDDLARVLDRKGWMIVPQETTDGAVVPKWLVNGECGYVPAWAEDIEGGKKREAE